MKKIIISSMALLAGCASVLDGGPDTINLMTSDGSKVQAQIYSKAGVQQLTLPTLVTVPKSCSDIAVNIIEDKNVNQSNAIVSSGLNPWTLGNLVFGWLLGFAVDGVTGNICTYDSSVIVPVNSK